MGEWRIEEVDGDNPIVWIDEHTYFVAEHDPSMIVNTHNADCAAYRAELARVKAESLRVVADGEKCWLDDAGSEAAIYYDSVTDSNYILILTGSGTFLLTGEKIELGKDATVTPVRLERWEATDDHH